MSIAPGARLGPFEVTATLGAGGMGQVFRAHDARLHRDVAIKILPPEFASDPARMARFSREAQALAALNHPNIAAIYGLEESGGSSALVMELIEGQTLQERIAAGPIPVDEALALARQITEALEAAHEKGIIHRDLKPANIKITPDGKAKVLDFGLAKAMDADPISGSGSQQANSPTLTLDSTRAGQIMGTAAYMSPEQARGKAVDKRADIWAFGVVLYEMLSGKSMFEGETVSDTLAAVLHADIDLKNLPPDTPPKLRRLLARCLERDPKKRLRDIGDAWIEMDAPDPSPMAVTAAAPVKRRSWWPWAVAIVVGGAGVVSGLVRRPPAPVAPPMRWLIPQKSFAGFLSLSRDGTRVVYTEGTSNNDLHICVRQLNEFEGKALTPPDGSALGSFSPDGEWIVYGTPQAKIKKMPAGGGSSITVCDGTTSWGLAWGPDDTLIWSSSKSLFRVPATGGSSEQLTTPDAKNGEVGHAFPQYLPGGRQVLFTIATGNKYDKAAVLDLKTKTYRVVARAGAWTRYVPSGHLVFLRGDTLFAVPFDLGKMAPTGPEAPVIEQISTIGPPGYADYTFSDSGLLMYITGTTNLVTGTAMAWADRKGVLQPITKTEQPWGTGRLSPDGARIANDLPGSGGERDLWVYDIGRDVSTRLTFDGGNSGPIWTTDGRRLIYSATRDGKSAVYSILADGSGKPELLFSLDRGRAIVSSVTPDGRTIIYTLAGAAPRSNIMLFTVGGQPRPLHDAPFSESNGQVSPDGKWIAYESLESGSQEIYVQPFPGPGAKVRISQQGGSWPRWSRTMRELFFWEGSGPVTGLAAVEIQPGATFRAGAPQHLFSMPVGTTWDVAPDGKRFMVERSAATEAARGRNYLAVVTDWFDDLRRRAPAKK